jgi:hypothetical protein
MEAETLDEMSTGYGDPVNLQRVGVMLGEGSGRGVLPPASCLPLARQLQERSQPRLALWQACL